MQNPYSGMPPAPMAQGGPSPSYPPEGAQAFTGQSAPPPGGSGFVPSPPETKNMQAHKRRGGMSPFQVLLLLALLALIAWYLFQSFAPSAQRYGTVQAGMLGAYYTGDALIVRNETPYDADGVTSNTYVAKEGSNIARGTHICDVYSSGYSTRETTTLQGYRDQIRDYQADLLEQETTYDAKLERVETDVLSRAKEVRQIIAGTRGNLINQEMLLDAAITARQQYLRQKYSADQRLQRLYDDEQAQLQRIDSWTKQFVATRDGLISFYCDGYEYGLNTSNVATFSPQEVRQMLQGQLPSGTQISKSKTTIYRTVTDGQWYVLMLVDDNSWNPVEQQVYELQIERQENTVVSAVVDKVIRSGGELLVRLLVNAPVSPVLYIRTCKVQIGDSVTTLMVPARALYTQDGMQGVVVVDGDNQLFVPVSVVYRQGNDVYVTSIYQGMLYHGQSVLLF